MTIHPVDFVHSSKPDQKHMSTVRLRGTDELLTFKLVADNERADHDYRPGDRLIGWLGINLVAAEPRDVEGSKFDLIGIAASEPSDP